MYKSKNEVVHSGIAASDLINNGLPYFYEVSYNINEVQTENPPITLMRKSSLEANEGNAVSYVDTAPKYLDNESSLYVTSGANIQLSSRARPSKDPRLNYYCFSNKWNILESYFVISITRAISFYPEEDNASESSYSNFTNQPNSILIPKHRFQTLHLSAKAELPSKTVESHSVTPTLSQSPAIFKPTLDSTFTVAKPAVQTSASTLSFSSNSQPNNPPMELYKRPLTFSTGESSCSFVVNGTSLKLYNSDNSSYVFSSDDECDQRNQKVDAELLEGEREERYSEDYQKMRQQVELLDGVFPEDHVSPYYTVLHFKDIHQTEGELVSNLTAQMKQEECFQPIIAKYEAVDAMLNFDGRSWVADVRKAIKNRTASFDLIKEYHTYQELTITLKLQLQKQFYQASRFSDSSIYCDGCDIPPYVKNISAILNYSNGLLIRKFVGNEEVEYRETRRCGPFFGWLRMVPFQRSEIRCNRHCDSVWTQSFVCVPSVYVSLSRVRFPLSSLLIFRPIVLVIYATSSDETHLVRYISTHYIPKRVTILFYLVSRYQKSSSVFPINRLRNLAIRNIRTTHFLILDMDLRLSRSFRIHCFQP